MPLPPFLKRKDAPAARSRPVADGAEIQLARVRARRRLIGAAVLLVLGVIAFPLLFETQPRTIPVDIPIEAARNGGAAPALPKPASTKAVPPIVVDPTANVVVEAPAAAASAAGVTAPLKEAAKASSAPASMPTKTMPAPKPAPIETTREAAAATPASSAAGADPKPGRFVIQVGAFAESAAARDVRLKVERMGLKTYTQVVDTDTGKRTRVRIGPFDSRDEAAKVLGRLKTANLPGAVLAL
ncbi:MAG TPA: SPOR domain-containing protein [Rubrivivax sp.]